MKPIIHAEVSITDAMVAHQLLDSPQTVGKVILRVR